MTVFVLTFAVSAQSQNTVGILEYGDQSYEGYTLFAPVNTGETYLIDNCGFIVNSWSSNFKPGLACYLREDGALIRTARVQSSFAAGGSGGRLEVISWNNDLTWSHDFSNNQEQSHHDIALMPNGNILVLLWDRHSAEETIAKGKQENLIDTINGFWSEKIWEIKLLPDNQFEIIWEWNSWDHIVQDLDENLEGYGIISEHPEKFNINYPPLSQSPDWMHMNSIDYNPELDQIVLSSRNFNEIYIIDHSTTTEEAKTGQGGKYGKGGDILYRWGNVSAYNQSSLESQKLFGQHDAHWIDEGLPGEGNILIFNNGFGRPGITLASSLEEISPDDNGDGFYELNSNNSFDPIESQWTYPEELTNEFYSGRISGSQRLPNGNTLVCLGRSGRFVELNADKEIIWSYQNPVSIGGPIIQGANPVGTDVFKIQRYAYDFPAFDGKDLSPTVPIELEPNDTECKTTSILNPPFPYDYKIYPNPFSDILYLRVDENKEFNVEIFNQLGQKVYCGSFKEKLVLNEALTEIGFYYLRIIEPDTNISNSSSIIKIK